MAKDLKPLRILSLDVENVLRVVAVHIKPDGRVVELTGRNRQGKSSVIDALWMALGGTDRIPDDPIHDGAEMGKVVVEIGDDDGTKYVVTRRIKAKEGGGFAPSLIVENEEGGKMQNPQTILNNLVGSLSYDPLQFIAMKPQEQFDLLKQFVAGVDFAEIERLNRVDFDARTVINRDAKAKRAQAAGVTIDSDLSSAVRADETALVAELAGASEANASVERWKSARAMLERSIDDSKKSAVVNRNRAAELRAEAEEFDRLAAACDEQASGFRARWDATGPCPEVVDTVGLQAKINQARAHNQRIEANERAAAELQRLTAEATVLENQAAALTKAIEDRNTAKAEAISKAEMPVPGIDFGDGAIYFDGHPLANASQAQKLEIAIAIAAATQPRLRFITTKNAALLDDDSWSALVRMAEEKDLLVIAETVKSGRRTAVVIEDGHVKKQPAQHAAE